jgi:hypothetical protein
MEALWCIIRQGKVTVVVLPDRFEKESLVILDLGLSLTQMEPLWPARGQKARQRWLQCDKFAGGWSLTLG